MAATNVQAFPGDVVIPGKQYAIELQADLAEADKSSTTWYRLLKGGMRTGANGYSTKCELLVAASGMHECVTFDFNHMVELSNTRGSALNVYRHDSFLERVGVVKFRLTEYGSSVFYLDMKIDHDIVAVDRTWTVNLKVVQGGSYIEAPTTFLEKITTTTGIVTQKEYDIGLAVFAVIPSSNAAPFTIMSTGNVGIGKTDPDYPLDVSGTFSYSGTTYNSGILGGGAHPVKDQLANSGTLTAGNWYRIAKNGPAVEGGTGGSRCMARFTITDVQTSEHSTSVFYAGSTFGRDPFFHLVANTSYDTPGVIEKVRLVDSENADSEGFAIDIYIHATVGSNAVQVVMDDNIQLTGFELVNYEANPNTTGMIVAEYDLGDITWGVSPADNGADSGIFMAQTGRVGIGTQTPSVPLHVFGDAAESNAPFKIQSADNYCGMIMVDTGGGVQLSSDSGTLRFITDYAADLTGGHEVARLTENELKIQATRSSRIYIEDTGSDNGTYYQGVYIGSPNGDTNAGIRMVVTHDANTSSNQRNIIGFTNRDLEFSSFSDNSTLSGAGTRLEMSISQSNNQVYIPNHLATAAPANIAATFNCGSSSYIRLIGGGGTSENTWNTTAVNMHYPNGGGGTTLFVLNGNQSSGDATYSSLYMLRKAYTGTDWTSNSTRVVKLGGLANGALSSNLEFREANSKLEFRTSNGGNIHYYAIDFD